MPKKLEPAQAPWRHHLHEIIYEADTPTGKLFDVVLIAAIILSLVAVLLESIQSVRNEYGLLLRTAEFAFTILFTVEYILRIISVRKPKGYIFSFFGIVDLMAIIPTYLSLFLPGGQALLVVRGLRLVRVFRVLKLGLYVHEADQLMRALRATRRKISVFLTAVFTLVIVIGSLMYLIEGEANGFTSIPRGIYWAIVTLTTVGYGDLAPRTNFGQALASVVMVIGYAIIAVPTGIVTVELGRETARGVSTQACPSCSAEGHAVGAKFCKDCGAKL